MKIKAIVSDFDGTIVSYEQKISNEVKAAISNYVTKGGIFSIATGRAYEGLLESMCQEIKLKTPQIVRGGAEIISSKTGEVIWGKYIPINDVKAILDRLLPLNDFILLAESGKDLFTKEGKSDPEFATGANIRDIEELPLNVVPKIAIPPLYSAQQIEPMLQTLINDFPQLHIVKTTGKRGVGMDINDGRAGKKSALIAYAKMMDINSQEIMGIGDSFNDLPLLDACGIKVAMGNAPTELKEVADFIVGTQAEDGVIEAIQKALES
ncbi:MAG: HAD family phosphatase [Candidatus Pacebacteria bacterium]|jgi:Cof subfamily protein (haloacid dehalogenase superfamily)|nr:HAD family phosphatase [Candidatus Paceibacterota bacterium]MBT3512338.1 HAD family phosphatase [Candidatus Paceibacterota bacterium]MBT4004916.1 HAD family phosphatase [Candidatus Paceibacterota bacterium]MBT4359329.1 HAD family phosphatase [Candidatus Paceibacterota bacterium]MBT6899181.1 HAD family phosphatase [Candidatus Paceibacterota bacterium]